MTIQYCKFCGALLVGDEIDGFCCLECQLDYEYLLFTAEESYLQAVND
jgi:hypothetical protein